MPKTTDISHKNNLEDFIKIATIESLAYDIEKVRAKLETTKEKLEEQISKGFGFDPEAFVIDGEPLIYNKILRQIKNLEVIIFDLKREEQWLFNNGKKHRREELVAHIAAIDAKIEELGTVTHPGLFDNYNGTRDEYNDKIRAYNTWYKKMYGSFGGIGGDGLKDKRRKSNNAKDKLDSVSYTGWGE